MKFLFKAFVLFGLGTSVYAWELDERNKSVIMVGTHHPQVGFVTFEEEVHQNCVHQHLYYPVDTDLGRSFFSTLLTAKVSKSKVRVGYTPPSSIGMCHLELVSLE